MLGRGIAGGGLSFQGGETQTQGILGQFGDAVDVELTHEVLSMGIDRLGTDAEHPRDLLGRESLGDVPQNIFLPAAQGDPPAGGAPSWRTTTSLSPLPR